jgi:HemY protein
MLRVFFYLALVFLVGLGFAWLADRPGEMVVTFDGYQYEVSLMVAAVVVAAIVAAVMIVWWLLKAVWTSPYAISRYFRVRRRDRGYQALSTGMIAAGSGDAALARRKGREATKLISADQEPLIHLLEAQTALLEGDHEAARKTFEAMLEDPEMRLLGLRGLYLEAERLGERKAARHYAAQAAQAAPQLGWAAESTLEELVEQGDWDGALRLADAQRISRQIDKTALNRRRAVLLTAKSMAQLDAEPLAARNAANEAVRLAPDFVPASIAAARAAFRQDDVRKGSKLLETIWKKAPHPQVADLYIRARPGDSTHDRLERALKLQSLKANNPEATYAVARAALEAGEIKQARAAGEALLRQEPRERAFLLMADIDEADGGDAGRVREWLARAVRAPRDAAWVADGYVSDRWAPFSPVTGRIDAFEWRVPVEQVAQAIEPERRVALPHKAEPEPDGSLESVLEIEALKPQPAPVQPPVVAPGAPAAEAVKAPPVVAPTAPVVTTEPAQPVPAPKPADAAATAKPAARKPAPRQRSAEHPAADGTPAVLFSGPPDDPGVDHDDESEAGSTRARLY